MLWALLAFMLAALAYIQYVTPYYGDDLTYQTFGDDQNWRGAIARHWDWLNGRLPNLLLALSVRYLPKSVVSLLAAALSVGWMWVLICMSLRTRRPSVSAVVLLLGVILIAFPWWDDFLMLAIEYNYVVASLFGLLFLQLVLAIRVSPVWIVPAMILSGAAGCMHEAQSAAILFGLAMYAAFNRATVFGGGLVNRLLLFGSFCVGSLVALSSPAVSRAVFEGAGRSDGQWWFIVLCSCPMAAVLAMAVAILYIYNVWRGIPFAKTLLGRLMHSDWSVFFFASIVSIVIVAFAGVIGRSGWFGNTFAMIALVRLVWPAVSGIRLRRGWRGSLAGVLVILIMAHLAAWAKVQTRLGRETENVTLAYLRSADGLVYSDGVLDRPTDWYLLGKAVTMPLPGQFFKTFTFSRHFGTTSRPLLVLPLSLAPGSRDMPPAGWGIVPELPRGASHPIYPHYGRTRVMVDSAGRLSAVDSASTRGYLVSPWPYDLTINNIAYSAVGDN